MTQPSTPACVADAVSEFGAACKDKLSGPGDREAAIRTPLEGLLEAFGERLRLKAVFHDEVRDEERRVRPDYGVSIDGAISGYVEVKAPGRGIDPAGFTGHDREQWERQRDLPNLQALFGGGMRSISASSACRCALDSSFASSSCPQSRRFDDRSRRAVGIAAWSNLAM